tara:strand:+ start:7150 stop:7716 length:567 start_codon:yes stop_codon:yes gene_type:complete
MPITLNGSGTVTGISAGGLPDGIIQSADLASGVGGKILQVVSTTKTDIFSSSTAQVFTDITGLSVDITPSATSSKILVTANVSFGLDVSHSLVVFRFVRDSTAIAIGDVANNRPRGTFQNKPQHNANLCTASGQHLDSPSSTSQLTYKVQFYDYHGNTFYVNRSYRHYDDSTYDMVGVSTITAYEVAA